MVTTKGAGGDMGVEAGVGVASGVPRHCVLLVVGSASCGNVAGEIVASYCRIRAWPCSRDMVID